MAGIHSVQLKKGDNVKTVQVGSKAWDKYRGQGYQVLSGTEKNMPKGASPIKGVDQSGTMGNASSSTSTPLNKPGTVPQAGQSGDQSVERFSKFQSALNVAVDEARKQRKDKTLDFLGGVIPAGAAPATTFANVVGAFDADSAPLEASLLNNASEFAMQQMQQSQQITQDIQALALEVGNAGGNEEAVASVLEFAKTGDLNGAITAASGYMGATDKWTDTQKLKLEAAFGPNWREDSTRAEQVDLIVNGTVKGGASPSGNTPSGSVPSGGVSLTDVNAMTSTMKDLEVEAKRILGPSYLRIWNSLPNDDVRRSFMDDYIYEIHTQQASLDPIIFLNEWLEKNPTAKKGGSSTSSSEKKFDPLSDNALLGIPE